MSSNFSKGLLSGVGLTLAALLFTFGSYTFYLYKTAEPGFKVSTKNKKYDETEKKEITGALVKLSGISDFFGFDNYSVLFTSSAAVIIGENAPFLAEFHFSRAIEIAERISTENNQFNPLLQIRFNYGLFLNDIEKKDEAKKYLNETLEIGLKNSPDSHWIDNIKSAITFVEKNS